jgi:hypothetical protein
MNTRKPNITATVSYDALRYPQKWHDAAYAEAFRRVEEVFHSQSLIRSSPMPLPKVVAQQNSQMRKALQDAGLPLLWSTYLLKIGRQLTNPLSSKPAPKVFWASPEGKTKLVYNAKKDRMEPKVFPVAEGDVLERLTFDLVDASIGIRPKLALSDRIKQISEIIFAVAASSEWDHPQMVSLAEKGFYGYFTEQAVSHRIKAPNVYREDEVIALLPMTDKVRRAL